MSLRGFVQTTQTEFGAFLTPLRRHFYKIALIKVKQTFEQLPLTCLRGLYTHSPSRSKIQFFGVTVFLFKSFDNKEVNDLIFRLISFLSYKNGSVKKVFISIFKIIKMFMILFLCFWPYKNESVNKVLSQFLR